MKIGDRVIYRNGDVELIPETDILDNEKATVISFDDDGIKIRFENILYCSECGKFLLRTQNPFDLFCKNCAMKIGIDVREVVWWANPENLTIDKEWLREEKLKELGL